MIFLSLPYRAESDELVENRVKAGRRVAACIMDRGHAVHCPVVAFHETIKQEDYSGDYEDWERMIEEMIVLSNKVAVLKLPGFANSEGVEGEIELAKKYNRDIEYLDPSRFDLDDIDVNLVHSLDAVRKAASRCTGETFVDCWEPIGRKHLKGECNCFE